MDQPLTPAKLFSVSAKAATTKFDLKLIDCIEGMQSITAKSVDVVITSPPYNIGKGYEQYQDTATRAEFLDWCTIWATEVNRVLRDDGSFFLNLGGSPKNPYLPHELLLQLREIFKLQNTIHWIKSITVEPKKTKPLSVGHFKPINSKRYLNDCHEYVFHLTKEGNTIIDRLAIGVPYSDKSNIARWEHTGGNDLRCRGNNWFIPYKTIQNRDTERSHPATFPAELARRCIAMHGKGADTVAMDPFLGIGNAALGAAEYKAKHFIGFEIDSSYLEQARQLIANSQGQLDLF